jgi:hypothetical protein
MRKVLAVAAVAGAAALGLVAPSANAGTGDALVTLAVGVGVSGVSIAAPTAVATPGTPATVTIATVVTDTRLSNAQGWTASISSDDLTLAGATTPGTAGTIPASTMTAYTGDVEPTVPGVAVISNDVLSTNPLTLSNTPQALVVASSRTNLNTAAYTVTVSVPTTGKTTGIYTGTVHQSVV